MVSRLTWGTRGNIGHTIYWEGTLEEANEYWMAELIKRADHFAMVVVVVRIHAPGPKRAQGLREPGLRQREVKQGPGGWDCIGGVR